MILITILAGIIGFVLIWTAFIGSSVGLLVLFHSIFTLNRDRFAISFVIVFISIIYLTAGIQEFHKNPWSEPKEISNISSYYISSSGHNTEPIAIFIKENGRNFNLNLEILNIQYYDGDKILLNRQDKIIENEMLYALYGTFIFNADNDVGMIRYNVKLPRKYQ